MVDVAVMLSFCLPRASIGSDGLCLDRLRVLPSCFGRCRFKVTCCQQKVCETSEITLPRFLHSGLTVRRNDLEEPRKVAWIRGTPPNQTGPRTVCICCGIFKRRQVCTKFWLRRRDCASLPLRCSLSCNFLHFKTDSRLERVSHANIVRRVMKKVVGNVFFRSR